MKKYGRFLLVAGVFVLALLFTWEVFSEELTVVEVRKNIPLSDQDPVYKDYYINSGSNEGLKKNQVVIATRKTAIRDASGTQTFGEAAIPVGQLKVIFLGEKYAIARDYKSLSRNDIPSLEQTAIMIGDKIEIKGSFVDNRKLPVKSAEQGETKAEAKAEPKQEQKPAAQPVPVAAAAPAAANTTANKDAKIATAEEKNKSKDQAQGQDKKAPTAQAEQKGQPPSQAASAAVEKASQEKVDVPQATGATTAITDAHIE